MPFLLKTCISDVCFAIFVGSLFTGVFLTQVRHGGFCLMKVWNSGYPISIARTLCTSVQVQGLLQVEGPLTSAPLHPIHCVACTMCANSRNVNTSISVPCLKFHLLFSQPPTAQNRCVLPGNCACMAFILSVNSHDARSTATEFLAS